VITFDRVTKQFADGTIGVDALSMEIGEGEVVVLVGPSGCGKTTTMRMVNRMIKHTSGTLTVNGRNVESVDPAQLRRGIGYVIQQIGLFPHRTVAENIATVPMLSGWDRSKISGRVDELVELVGLTSAVMDRYPHQLSGGQRQRVGVARALAADPPIMLMDEPFGAVDPIVRARLQGEFLRLQASVRKTIVFVTHDIDEAIRMGDRIAIMSEGGHLEQLDTPAQLLAEPANEFVVDFLGAERGLKRLALIPVSKVKADPGPVAAPTDTRTRAVEIAEAVGTDWVVVVADGILQGWVPVDEIAERVDSASPRPFKTTVNADDSLRAALDAMITSQTGVAVRISEGNRYEGILTPELLSGEIVE
jgi:osmoprotectant transport system ATP-binding protein